MHPARNFIPLTAASVPFPFATAAEMILRHKASQICSFSSLLFEIIETRRSQARLCCAGQALRGDDRLPMGIRFDSVGTLFSADSKVSLVNCLDPRERFVNGFWSILYVST